MAITYVGGGTPYSAASGNVTPYLPAGTQKDDLLLIACGLNGSDTLSCSGYTKKAEYTAGGGGMDLVVHLEMLAGSARSETTGQTTYDRSKIQLDPDNYDGATYYFEVAVTTATTTSYDIELYDVTNATVEATIATGTTALTYTRLRSSAFTPAAGNSTFAIRVPQTTTTSDVIVFTARIVVVQSGATKTRLQFPLSASAFSTTYAATTGYFDSTTSATYTQATPAKFSLWRKEASKLATIATGTPWTLEGVLNNASAAGIAYMALYNATDGTPVTGAELSYQGAGGVIDLATSVDFADTAVNFTDLDEFEVRIKSNNASYTMQAFTANLYVKLTSLTKAQVFTRVAGYYTGTGGSTMPQQRMYYDEAQWSSGATWYFEATGIDASATPAAFVGMRYSTVDTGTGSSMATTMTLTAARARQRSTAITLTDEQRYLGRAIASSGTASFASEFLVAELSVSSGDETQVTVFWKRHSGTETTPTVTGASNAICAKTYAFRGVDLGVDPWDAYDAALASGTTTNVTFPALTTATDEALAVAVGATASTNSYNFGYVGYGNLTAPRGMDYVNTTLGDDCSFVMLYGTQASNGSIGSPYATKLSLTDQFWVSTVGALKPATAAVDFDLTIACQVASETASAWTQADITSHTSSGSEVGDSVTITGTGFGTDGTVTFGTTAAVITSWSSTQVACVIPDVADATYTVTLAPYGDYYSDSFTFVVNTGEVLPTAVITALSASSGVVGSTLTLTGTDFGTEGVVKFGATTATQTSYADTSIVCIVPSIAVGAYSVTVTPTARTTSAPLTFTITATAPEADPTETNPLFDGTLTVTVGGLDVTDSLLPGLSYSTTNPGGFGEAQLRLPATDPGGQYDDAGCVARGAAVVITHGSTTLFEGEVTNDVSHAVIEGGEAYYDVTAAGLWWKAGQRKDFCATFSDDDYGQWFQRPGDSQAYTVSTEGEVKVLLEKGGSCAADARASLYYWLDGGMGNDADEIAYLIAYVDVNVQGDDWYATIASAPHPWSPSEDWNPETTWNAETLAAGTPYRNAITAGCKALRVRLYTTAAVATAAADRYVKLYRMSVLTRSKNATISANTKANPTQVNCAAAHDLVDGDRVFIYGTNSVPDIDGWRTITYVDADSFTVPVNVATSAGTAGTVYIPYRLDDAIAAIAGEDATMTTDLASTFSVETGGIGNANWGLNVRPHTSRADAIETLAATHQAPVDYGFWDSAAFHCSERPYSTRTVYSYAVDSDDPAVDSSVFKNTEDSPTHVKILFTFRDVDGGTSEYPDGTLACVYRPDTPDWEDASVVLDVWDEWADLTLTVDQAEDIGDQILSWIDDNQYSGTITVATDTVTIASTSTERNTAYVRAGDYVEDTSIDTGPLMITTMAMDVDSGTATLGIGETRADFVARVNPPKPSNINEDLMKWYTTPAGYR